MAKKEVIELKPIDIKEITLHIVGTTPLICHKWDEKTRQEMLDKQMGKAKTKKHDIKNPVRDFIESLYWLDGKPDEPTEEGFESAIANGARFGFPTNGIKAEATPNTEMILIVDVDLDLLKELHNHGAVRNLKDRRVDLFSLIRKK
mgnify:CR=1 FL=1